MRGLTGVSLAMPLTGGRATSLSATFSGTGRFGLRLGIVLLLLLTGTNHTRSTTGRFLLLIYCE